MISFYPYKGSVLNVAPDPEPAQMAKYRKHVAAGTVPPESQIPYTRTGVEKYRNRSRLDDFKPGRPPEYPQDIKTYVALFNMNRNYK